MFRTTRVRGAFSSTGLSNNAPFVFRGVWKLTCPWLDDELRSKVHFAPGDVNDVEGGIEYLNGMKLRVGPV
jgi:hypothetical protein